MKFYTIQYDNRYYYTGKNFITEDISLAFLFTKKSKIFEYLKLNPENEFSSKYTYKVKEIEIIDKGEVFHE